MPASEGRPHHFAAIAFVENLALRSVAPVFPGARVTAHELQAGLEGGGEVFVYPFGAVCFHDVEPARRDAVLSRLRAALPALTTQIIRENFVVRENPEHAIGVFEGLLVVDAVTPARAGVIALTIAQSAAMEYYEAQVTRLFARSRDLVDRLERTGRVGFATRMLHRFVGEALSTRGEVIAVLHLLDKPDATWDDPAMDEIYDDLRDAFDLPERYEALEARLGSVLETLQLVLDVTRDRRMLLLEAAIVVLILFEIVMSFVRGG